MKTQHLLLQCSFLPEDQIFPIIDIEIEKSNRLAYVRCQNQNVLSDGSHDIE